MGNKGKQKKDSNGNNEKKPSKENSRDQRLVLSRRISVLVSPSKDVDNFHALFKVSRTTFSYICSIVREKMVSRVKSFMFLDGKIMSLNDQVAIALTRLSTVDSTINVANFFRTHHSTVFDITWRFVMALKGTALHHLTWPPEMASVKSRFKRTAGLPNCCGAIESTHLKLHLNVLECKSKLWADRENNNSMILQVIVDPTMRFVDVVTGWPGMMKNDDVLSRSSFFTLAQKRQRLNGNEIELSNGTKVREYLVGGSSFQLLPWLITPYNQNEKEELTEDQIEFNKKHSATRLAADRALKKLKDVWAVVDGGMWQPDKHQLPRIVLACCILHNIVIDMEGDGMSDVSKRSGDHDPGYPPEKSEVAADGGAVVIRDKLCLHLAGKLLA